MALKPDKLFEESLGKISDLPIIAKPSKNFQDNYIYHNYLADSIPIRYSVMRDRANHQTAKFLFEKGSKDSYQDYESDRIIDEYSTYIHGMKDETFNKQISYPLTWWDHFKAQYFHRFLLNLFPPKYKTTEFTEHRYIAICPHLVHDDTREHLHWMSTQYEKNKELI